MSKSLQSKMAKLSWLSRVWPPFFSGKPGTRQQIISLIQNLKTGRRGRFLLIHSDINEQLYLHIYELLRRQSDPSELNLLLFTPGGEINFVRPIFQLLRAHATSLKVFIPYQASSAGTLLSLGSDEIVMNRVSRLSPVDPQVQIIKNNATGQTTVLAATEIQAFYQMTEDWFHLESEEARLQLLSTLSQQIFIPTLARLYRSFSLVRDMGNDLLAHHLPDSTTQVRLEIIDHLISGYYSHSSIITYQEAKNLGLCVTLADENEDDLLWKLHHLTQRWRREHERPLVLLV